MVCLALAATPSGVGQKETPLAEGTLGIMGPGEQISITTGNAPARFLLVAGREIGEPVARYGPFVMNTREEILQAIHDFQNGPPSQQS